VCHVGAQISLINGSFLGLGVIGLVLRLANELVCPVRIVLSVQAEQAFKEGEVLGLVEDTLVLVLASFQIKLQLSSVLVQGHSGHVGREEKSTDKTGGVDTSADKENLGGGNFGEVDGGKQGTALAHESRNTMAESTNFNGVSFGSHNVSGGVCTEVDDEVAQKEKENENSRIQHLEANTADEENNKVENEREELEILAADLLEVNDQGTGVVSNHTTDVVDEQISIVGHKPTKWVDGREDGSREKFLRLSGRKCK